MNGKASTLYYAGVTMPLGNASGPLTVSGNLSRDTAGQTQLQSTLSGSRGEDGSLAYSVTANHVSGQGSSRANGSGNVTYRSQIAEVNASLGMSASYQQGSFGVRGAVVAHPGGVTLSLPLSETFGIVKAPGAAGARVISAPGVRVNSRGYALVPYLTPYNMNTVELDPKGLSLDVELKETSQQVAPRAGAAPLLTFPTAVGRAALIQASHADGTPLPFGASAYDSNGKPIGLVGQAGKLFVRGLSEAGTLTVKWGATERERCVIPYELAAPQAAGNERMAGYRHFKGVCQPEASMPAAMLKP
jgi:outer membrane usher protein